MSSEEIELKKGQKRYLQGIVNKFNEDAEKAINEIEKIKKSIVSGSETTLSIEKVEEIKNEFLELHSEIFEENDDGETIEDIITEFKTNFEKEKKEIEDIQKSILKYEEKLLGKKDENGNRLNGIEQQIDSIQKQLSENLKNNEIKQQALFLKIEELMQGASTVALADAFAKHKKEFDTPNKLWQNVFIYTLIALMGFTLISFFASNAELKDMWKITLGNLPFIGAGVWLAIFASKQRSQNVRLQQEYAYKEDVAKLYYGLKNEIEQLDNSELGKKLNESVITILVDTVSYNPSQTLDNHSHNDKGPILEALKSISEAVKIK